MANGNVDDTDRTIAGGYTEPPNPDTAGGETKALEDAEIWDREVQRQVAKGLPLDQAELLARALLTKKYGLTMEDAASAHYPKPHGMTGLFSDPRQPKYQYSESKGKTLNAIAHKKIRLQAEKVARLKGLEKAQYELAMKQGRIEDAKSILSRSEDAYAQQARTTRERMKGEQLPDQNIGPSVPQAFPTSQSYQGLTREGMDLAKGWATKQKAVLNAIIYNPEEYDEKVSERDMMAASLGMTEAQMALLPRVDDRKGSPSYGEYIGDFSDAGWEYKKLIDEQNLARRAAVENFELDLGGSFEGREKMIAAISLIIGSIGAGLTGGDNLAAKALNRHIERDIKRQMIKQKAKIQDLDLNHAQQKEMFMFAQKEQLEGYRRQVEKLALNTADLRLQDQYKVMLGGIDLQLAQLMQVKTSSTQIPSSEIGGGKLSDAQKDAAMISAVTVDLAKTYEDVVAKGGGLSRWIGHFGKDKRWLISLGRITGLMDKHTSVYLNKATMAVARITKTLQGSRPSDFDWKKLETLIPGTRDDPELARADFQAIMDIAEVTATAELEFEKRFGGKSYGNNPQGEEERRRDYASSGAGRKLTEIGTRLDELDKRGELDSSNAASVVSQWAYNLGAVENW